jgi:hypothetical protein
LAYVNKVLELEFEVPESVLLSEEKKRKKEEKKRKAQAKLAAIRKAKQKEEEEDKKQEDERTTLEKTQDLFIRADTAVRAGETQNLGDIIRKRRKG